MIFFIISCYKSNNRKVNQKIINIDNTLNDSSQHINSKVRKIDNRQLNNHRFSATYNFPVIHLYEKNKSLISLFQPNDGDVKNLLFDSITDTKKGFNLYFSWGDFKYQHSNIFIFETKNKYFYLTKIKTSIYESLIDSTSNYDNKIKPIKLNKTLLLDVYNSKKIIF